MTHNEFSENSQASVKSVSAITDDEMILDLGPQTVTNFAKLLKDAGTIIWNGPLGVFEFEQFANGTKMLANAIAASAAFSIAGGGDTLAAIATFGISEKISYISTGGGAFLEFLGGKTLPAVAALSQMA